MKPSELKNEVKGLMEQDPHIQKAFSEKFTLLEIYKPTFI